MKIIHNDFTQTVGIGNTVRNVFELKINPETEPGMKDGFKSYSEYLDYYNSGDKRGKSRLKKKLDRLKDTLMIEYGYSIDPVIYLANLYYGDELSVVDVHERVVDKGMDYTNDNSIEKTFNLTFGWELRDTTGGENTRKKNRVVNKISTAKEVYETEVSGKYEKIKDYVSDNIFRILSIKKSNFNNKFFESLHKTEKVIYVTETFLGLQEEDIIEMNKLGPGARVIANYLNSRIQVYAKNYNFECTVFPKDIQAILNKYKINDLKKLAN